MRHTAKHGSGHVGVHRQSKLKGRHLDAEARQDISAGMKGKKHPHRGSHAKRPRHKA